MRDVFWLQLILNLLNVALNLLFFELTDWNVKGVALATIIAEYVALAYGLSRITPLWKSSKATLFKALTNIKAFIEYFSISRDLFIRTVCLTFAFYWITVLGSRFGDTTLALNAILILMLHFTSHALDGFSIAAESLVGHALGRKDRQALARDIKACTWGALVLAVVFTLVYLEFGQAIVNAMTTLPEVRREAPVYLFWVVIGPLVGVWSFLLDGIFIGATHTKEMRNGMLISVAFFVVVAELLVPSLGNTGLWVSYHLFMIARIITLGVWFPRVLRAAEQP